jgi:hypothetical protein
MMMIVRIGETVGIQGWAEQQQLNSANTKEMRMGDLIGTEGE